MGPKSRITSGGASTDRPPPTDNDITPPYRGNDYRFEYQALFDIQKSIGELKSTVDSLKVSIDSTKSKVDDLVGWKHKILGGAIVLGAVFTFLGFIVAKFSSYVTITAPHAAQQIESSGAVIQPPIAVPIAPPLAQQPQNKK